MGTQEQPKRYGKCVIEKEIGRGARSTVYLAWHEGLQIPVAVKVMRKEGGGDEALFSERFTREARIAAQLTHHHIVRVYDCGQTDDSYYLVLEYIEGESCRERMETGADFTWKDVATIIRQVAEGLNYASTKGIIHRDLKPENIMIDKEGNARIADLGLAKEVGPGRASATADGDVLGTPYYMSPEQVRQPGDVDFRADVYSLGATLYHLVTGHVPFEAPTPFEIMTMHLNEPLTPPQVRKPELPEALCDIIMRSMAKEPQSRYQSYGDLIRDLDSLLSGGQQRPVDAVMAAVEDSLDEEPIEEPLGESVEAPHEEPVPEVAPRLRSLTPAELPTTVHNIRSKALGLGAVLAYAFLTVCIAYLCPVPREGTGLAAVAAGVAMAVMAAASAAAAYRAVNPPPEEEEPHAFDQQFSAALGWLCERLELPTPLVLMRKRFDESCRAFSSLGGRGVVYVPAEWLAMAKLDDARLQAFLAQKLASVYNGDAFIRTVLALPIGILSLGERVAGALLGPRRLSARTRLKLSRAGALVGMGAVCTVIAVLLFLGFKIGAAVLVWVGVLVLMLLCTLLLISAFERQGVICGDYFAVRVVGSADTVRSLVIVSGLLSLERDRLLHEALGPLAANVSPGGLPAPNERATVIEGVAGHYSAVAYSPDTLELARKALSGMPSAAERLNRLAKMPRKVPLLLKLAALARRSYARLLKDKSKQATNLLDLAEVRPFVRPAVAAGALATAVVGILSALQDPASQYLGFVLVVAAVSLALGFVVAREASKRLPTAGQLGWGLVVSTTCLTVVTMVGFPLVGCYMLSVQFPIVLFVSGALGVVAATVLLRLRPAGAQAPPAPAGDAGSKTAHTMMVSARDAEAEPPAPEAAPEAPDDPPADDD